MILNAEYNELAPLMHSEVSKSMTHPDDIHRKLAAAAATTTE